MLVSIITPSYNSEKFIAQTIESVQAQTHQAWEMIIVDDCSTDDSNDVIESYIQTDKRIRLIKLTTSHGPGPARNEAIKQAKGKYIAFLDADDLWMPNKLQTQLAHMNLHDLAFCYASYDIINENNITTGQFKTKEKITYTSMLKTCSVGCLTAIYDVEKIGKHYMVDMKKGEDLALWLSILKKIPYSLGVIEPLAYYRVHSNTLSSNKLNAVKAQWKVYREIEQISVLKSSYYLAHYTWHGFFKYR